VPSGFQYVVTALSGCLLAEVRLGIRTIHAAVSFSLRAASYGSSLQRLPSSSDLTGLLACPARCRCSSAAGELVTSGALAAAQQLMSVPVEAPLQFVLTHDKGAASCRS
jgi:hypothetical protein